jgi:hypothetical protein
MSQQEVTPLELNFRQIAKNLADTAWDAIYESQEIRAAAEQVANHHGAGDCEESRSRADILITIANGRLNFALEALGRLQEMFKTEDKTPKAKTPKPKKIAKAPVSSPTEAA